MLKKLVDKRIEVFKKHFPEYQISKNGSVYVRRGVRKVQKKFTLGGFSVTKGCIGKIGRVTEFETEVSSHVYLITKTGKLMQRNNSNRFESLTLSKVKSSTDYHHLKDIYLIGRKYEWMKNYPLLLDYKFFKSFNSLAEARKFLGFGFVSDADFYSLFHQGSDILTTLIKATDKSNAFKLLKNADRDVRHLLKDYIDLCIRTNSEIEIPAGKNRLKQLHDNAVWEALKEDAKNYSKKELYELKEATFETAWKAMGIEFKRLSSPYEMFITGAKQKHCIGTNYYNQLKYNSFYSIMWDGLSYEIQITPNGYINQFYGFDNSHPPKELEQKIRSLKEEDYKHTIIEVPFADFTNYPKDYNKKDFDEEREELYEDDIPW